MAAIPTSVNAQERACVISDSGKKVCGKLVRDNDEDRSSTPSPSMAIVKFANMAVNVQLLKCSRKTSTVSCKFSATMVDLDPGAVSAMEFFSGYGTKVSQITDSKGEDYIADKVILGKSESKDYLRTTMVKDQPVSITVLFKIPPGVNTIKTLSFLTGDAYYQKAALFANINISR